MARTRLPGLQRTKSGRISRSRASLLQQGKLVSADYIVYFAKANRGVKIGYSGATRNRMADLTAQEGEAVRVLGMAFVPTSAVARKLEAKMHVLFKDKWIVGEWFDLNMSDVMMALGMCRKIPHSHIRRGRQPPGRPHVVGDSLCERDGGGLTRGANRSIFAINATLRY